MTVLLIYLFIALGFSFLCSVTEAVLLSISTAYINVQHQKGKPSAALLKKHKKNIDEPLAAILTLNTIAHTAGAAGVGAQASMVFGDHALGIASAIMTFLILVFSEIIPKTLGSVYWRSLAPMVAYTLKYMMIVLAPFVWLSKFLTKKINVHPTLRGFNREEFAAMAQLGEKEGQLSLHEAKILQNVFKLRDMPVKQAMTPAVVMFSLPESITVDVFFHKYEDQRFSRIPVYSDNQDQITGFVLRGDLLKAKARGNQESLLSNYKREVITIPETLSLLSAFELCLTHRSHILIVVNEYGVVKGLITLEDIIETLMGLEIVDEHDKDTDLQKLAKNRWRKRARDIGVDPDEGE